MNIILSISVGAVIGALSRHYMMIWVAHIFGTAFPWGTLLINLLGSFLMGGLMQLLAIKFPLSQEIRVLLTVGILGSFTTFSTFSLDAVQLIQSGDFISAIIYVFASIAICIGALFGGIYLVELFS
jgi:CrcB protein